MIIDKNKLKSNKNFYYKIKFNYNQYLFIYFHDGLSEIKSQLSILTGPIDPYLA